MANDDPNVAAAIYRDREIQAKITAANADREAHNLNGDVQSAAACIQEIATLSREREDLHRLYNQYVQSQNPPPRQEQTKEELQAKSWDKMDWNDALELARTSKYGSKLDWRDPHVRAGYNEVLRKRATGER
jgi:hypothetical protein